MKLSVVNFRLKPEEEQALRMKAAADGMNVSDFCRSRILSENVPHETSEKASPDLPDFLELKSEVETMCQDLQRYAKNSASIAEQMTRITSTINTLISRVDNLTKTIDTKL